VGLALQQHRYQNAFRWIDLRSRDRSRLTLAPLIVRSRSSRTLSPTANRPSSSAVDRRVKLTLAVLPGPFDPLRCQGRCAYPTSATDFTTRALHRSFGPRITAALGFHRDSSFHGARRPKPWRVRDRVGPRLTASLQLRQRSTIVPGFPGISAPSSLGARDLEPSEKRSLPPALSTGREGRHPASDALCRAPRLRVYGI
jgi:hypothetical protein